MSLAQRNHYVPRTALKYWANEREQVQVYRTLVSHERVPSWRRHSLRGIAQHAHLYCEALAGGGESDEVERWLAEHVDDPASKVLEKVEGDRPLKPADWRTLQRFFAAASARTPASLLRSQKRWETETQDLLDQTLAQSVQRIESGKVFPKPAAAELPEGCEMPMRLRVQPKPESGGGAVEAELLLGRKLWFFELRWVVERTSRHLARLKWTILRAPEGMRWLTSDDPAVCVGYNGPADFWFQAGWGRMGTDLFLPLTPQHLLYTQVGRPVPQRYSTMPVPQASTVQHLIVRHAHRHVFAVAPEEWVASARPRRVAPEAFAHEQREWREWHPRQSAAERDLLSDETWGEQPA